jgi:hypothetical protein
VLTWTTGDRLLVTICAGCFLIEASRRKVIATDSPRSQSIEQSFAELKAHLRKAASDTPVWVKLIFGSPSKPAPVRRPILEDDRLGGRLGIAYHVAPLI